MSINAIAEKFNVSCATVSNALAGRGRMRSDLREKILAYAQKIGFRPNANASRLRRGETKQILFCAALEPGNNFAFNHAILTHYLTNALIPHGYDLLIHPYNHTSQCRNDIVPKALDHSVDGIILQTDATLDKDLLQALTKAPIPIINYDASSDALETAQVSTLTHSFVDSLLLLFAQKQFPPESKVILLVLDTVVDDRLVEDLIRVTAINHMEDNLIRLTVTSGGLNYGQIWQDILHAAAGQEAIVCCRIDTYFDGVYQVFNTLPPEVRQKIHLVSSIHKLELERHNYHNVLFIPYDFDAIAISLSDWILSRRKSNHHDKSILIQYGEVIDFTTDGGTSNLSLPICSPRSC